MTDAAVIQILVSECTADGLLRLLDCEVGEMQEAAVVCLGLKGEMQHCRALADVLHHENVRLAEAAEQSLWHIWMRAGSDSSNELLSRAVEHVRCERYADANGLLDCLINSEPTFAEAHHQLGIVYCFRGRNDDAGESFRMALRLNPYHFAAAANLGHTYVEEGDVLSALRYYRYALRIHPRLADLREAVRSIEAAQAKRSAS